MEWSFYCYWVYLSLFCQSYGECIYHYCCFHHPLVILTLTPVGMLDAPHGQSCLAYCHCGLPYLVGLLVNLACSLLRRMEMELVLSYDHLPCLLCQFSSVSCYLLSSIQFVQAYCFQNS